MKKEEELKIGDIVIITSSSNVLTIGLLLGYELLKCYNLLCRPDIVNRMMLLTDRVDEATMQPVLSRLKH